MGGWKSQGGGSLEQPERSQLPTATEIEANIKSYQEAIEREEAAGNAGFVAGYKMLLAWWQGQQRKDGK